MLCRNTTVLSWREKHHVNLGGEASDALFVREAAGWGEATLGLESPHLDSSPDSASYQLCGLGKVTCALCSPLPHDKSVLPRSGFPFSKWEYG